MAEYTVPKPSQVGGMGYQSGQTRVLEDAGVDQTVAYMFADHARPQNTGLITKTSTNLEAGMHVSDTVLVVDGEQTSLGQQQ